VACPMAPLTSCSSSTSMATAHKSMRFVVRRFWYWTLTSHSEI
jgi:hypothetical protein